MDGAHNPAGAEALAVYLRTLPPFVLVFGVMEDKDIPLLARALFALPETLILTRVQVRRAASPRLIAQRAGTLVAKALFVETPKAALAKARALAKGRPVVVAGSLYLVGEVLALLTRSRK